MAAHQNRRAVAVNRWRPLRKRCNARGVPQRLSKYPGPFGPRRADRETAMRPTHVRQQPARRRLDDRHWLVIGALVFLAEVVAAVAILGAVL